MVEGMIGSLLTVALVLQGQLSGALAAQTPSFQTPYVTRAEAAMILLQSRIPTVPTLTSNDEFPDVPKGAWYERYIVAAERLGILHADTVTRRIRPEDPVTRAEFMSMALKTFGVNAELFLENYADVPREAWYAGAAGMAQRLRLFPADPDQNLFKPDTFMIHSEVAKSVQILANATVNDKRQSQVILNGPAVPSGTSTMRISTDTQSVSLIKPRGPSPKPTITIVRLPPAGSDPAQIGALRTEVMKLVNSQRVKYGLTPLQTHPALEASAQQYARDMANQGFFGHISPAGETLKNRMENSGYYRPFFQSDCLCAARFVIGENLARGQKTAKEVVADWLNSPAHREAMLNPAFTDTGIGINAGIWVQHFGGKQK